MKRASARETIRKYCLESCMNGQRSLVETCADLSCALYPCRCRDLAEPEKRPVRLIRLFCLACVHGDRVMLRECSAKQDCLLWPFRFGVSEKTLERMRKRLNTPKRLTLPGLE